MKEDLELLQKVEAAPKGTPELDRGRVHYGARLSLTASAGGTAARTGPWMMRTVSA
jgi:hypothetical protein